MGHRERCVAGMGMAFICLFDLMGRGKRWDKFYGAVNIFWGGLEDDQPSII